jgi:hypothetical protein
MILARGFAGSTLCASSGYFAFDHHTSIRAATWLEALLLRVFC